MKKDWSIFTWLVVLAIFLNIDLAKSQTVSCGELTSYVKSNYSYKDYTICMNSTMLSKVEYYEVDNYGFVVGYIKRNDFDIYGTQYIFCGISRGLWSQFKISGMTNSWGKAFHAYIMDMTCNCN